MHMEEELETERMEEELETERMEEELETERREKARASEGERKGERDGNMYCIYKGRTVSHKHAHTHVK